VKALLQIAEFDSKRHGAAPALRETQGHKSENALPGVQKGVSPNDAMTTLPATRGPCASSE
jgi:hypothetical protein